jgi:hypothetical protein
MVMALVDRSPRRPAGQVRFYKFTAAADTSPRKRRSCGGVAFRLLAAR